MCEKCDESGHGEKWYMNPKNHARRIYRIRERVTEEPPLEVWTRDTDGAGFTGGRSRDWGVARMSESMAEVMNLQDEDPKAFAEAMEASEDFWMWVNTVQVLSLKESMDMLEVANPLATVSCICARFMRGIVEDRKDNYRCLATNVGIAKWERWPERFHGVLDAGGPDFITPNQAKEWTENWVKRGMVPAIMNEAGTLGGFCLCDYPICISIRLRMDYGVRGALLKGHYVAIVDRDKCTGCGDCVSACQFGAMRMEVTLDKVNIDPFRCFGCSVCSERCPRSAITMVEREKFPALRGVW